MDKTVGRGGGGGGEGRKRKKEALMRKTREKRNCENRTCFGSLYGNKREAFVNYRIINATANIAACGETL